MNLRSLGLVLVAWALAAAAAAEMAAEGRGAVSAREAAPPAVLVELFTSQGCSSCPPADRLLSRLTEDLPSGTVVVPLAFHVDYWNYIGWTDPFSSAEWSERQRRYAGRLESRGVYTPQMVVDGRWDAVGSVESDVAALIERAHRDRGGGRIGIEAHLAPDGLIDIDLSADLSSQAAADRSGDLVLWLAVVESGFETPVGRGENVHKTLNNDHVVRRLLAAFELGTDATAEGSVRIEPDPDWQRDSLSVAAFVQDRVTLRVYGAASSALAD